MLYGVLNIRKRHTSVIKDRLLNIPDTWLKSGCTELGMMIDRDTIDGWVQKSLIDMWSGGGCRLVYPTISHGKVQTMYPRLYHAVVLVDP